MFLREPSHWLLLLLVVVVLFGARRLPDAARGLGRSLRIFKAEVKQMKDDDARPGTAAPGERERPANPEALEGRVVEPKAAGTAEARRDA